MRPVYWMIAVCWLLFLIVFLPRRRQKIASNDGSVQGTIREVSGGGMLIEDARGQMQAVNLEYVTRIREYPRNKKGKKESVILD